MNDTLTAGGKAFIPRPCDECPWRRDVATGHFPPERFVALAPTAYDMSLTQFACHKTPRGAERACAGFLAVGALHNLGARLAYSRGKYSPVNTAGLTLYRSFREMAEANGVQPDHPALTACRED